MPRPREFEPDVVLDKAMYLFWRQGYHDTSLQELEAAMEINRFSIYATFENKHSLFLAALERYRETIVSYLISGLEAPDAGLNAVRDFFIRFVTLAEEDMGRWGCLIANSATELANSDADVAGQVVLYKERVQGAFRHALNQAKTRGDLAPDANVEETVVFLMGSVFGLMVYTKSGAPREELATYVEVVLARIR